jgi:hypothetical protein
VREVHAGRPAFRLRRMTQKALHDLSSYERRWLSVNVRHRARAGSAGCPNISTLQSASRSGVALRGYGMTDGRLSRPCSIPWKIRNTTGPRRGRREEGQRCRIRMILNMRRTSPGRSVRVDRIVRALPYGSLTTNINVIILAIIFFGQGQVLLC